MKVEKQLSKLFENQSFIDFYCYKEDKWLQEANMAEKLVAVFGSVENAITEFENDSIFNTENY